jgi:hypothetical protein
LVDGVLYNSIVNSEWCIVDGKKESWDRAFKTKTMKQDHPKYRYADCSDSKTENFHISSSKGFALPMRQTVERQEN